MSYFYVKDGYGTGGVPFGSQQTGPFSGITAASVYPTIQAAIADPAFAAGDYILVSNVHDHLNSSNAVFTGPIAGYTSIASVSDSAAEVYSAGAREYSTSGSVSIYVEGKMAVSGMFLDSADDVGVVSNDSSPIFHNCILRIFGASKAFVLSGNGGGVTFYNCEFRMDGTSTRFNPGINFKGGIKIYGGSVTTTTAGLQYFITASSSPYVAIKSLDLRAVTGVILSNIGAGSGDDGFTFVFEACAMSAGVQFSNEDFVRESMDLKLTRCGRSDSEAHYQYYFKQNAGITEHSADIFREESTPYPDGTKISMKLESNAQCQVYNPVFCDTLRFAPLSTTSKIRIYFASLDNALTDTQVWAAIMYADGLFESRFGRESNINANPISAGTVHQIDTGSNWKDGVGDLAGYTEYYMDIEEELINPGADCVVTVQLYLGKPSTSVYFDPVVELI